MKIDWARLPLLVLVVLLMLYGGYTYERAGQQGEVLIAAGLILIGAWLTTEVVSWWVRLEREDSDAGD